MVNFLRKSHISMRPPFVDVEIASAKAQAALQERSQGFALLPQGSA